MTPEDEEFTRIERESKIKQETVKHMLAKEKGFKIYTVKPWIGLVEQEIEEIKHKCVDNMTWDLTLDETKFAQAIEAKLKEKNSRD